MTATTLIRGAWLGLALLATPALAQEMCPAIKAPALSLARVRDAIARNQEVTIVALGSSSTAGFHATDIGHSYPAILQQELQAALPQAHIAVLNRGVGGQDVSEMLPRMERDALMVRPALVIWQVGANGAMRHANPDIFRRLVTSGVQRLRDAKVDVVLMDNQRAPMIMAAPEHSRIDQVMADVAKTESVELFDRGGLMDRWKQAGHPYEQFISDDGVHHNDRGYTCVAKALAAAILAGLNEPARPAAPALVRR